MEDKYLIIWGRDSRELQKNVNEKVDKGYVPCGNMVVVDINYYQPMIQKYIKDSL